MQDGGTAELCDPGAEQLARDLARSLRASTVLQNYSRVVADCARPPEHVDFTTEAGQPVSRQECNARHALIVQPYYEAIRTEVKRLSRETKKFVLVISLHTVDDSRIADGSILLAEARGTGLSPLGRAGNVLREELQRMTLLGTPVAGGLPFSGEHLALAGQVDLPASTITIKVARQKVGDLKFVGWLRKALIEANLAANDALWSLQPSRLARMTGKTAGRTLVVALPIAAALVAVVGFILDQSSKRSQQIAHYGLVVDGHHADVTNILVGVSHEIRLANRIGRTESYPDALVCRLQEQASRLANLVVQKSACTFEVTGSRTLFADSRVPHEVPFGVDVIDESGTQSAVPATVLVFQAFARPTPIVSGESVAVESPIVARLEPGTDGASVAFSDCTWQPAEFAMKFDPIDGGCQATFITPRSPGPTKTMSMFVTATATISKYRFPVSSNDAVVAILPRQPGAAAALLPSPTPPASTNNASLRSPASDRPQEAVPYLSLAALPNPATASPQTAPLTGVAELIRSIRDTRDNDRYIALRDGLAGLNATTRLDPWEALSLLGPLSGTLRMRALTNWILPRMSLPMPAEGGVSLIGSLEAFDRVELLHDLGGCALVPLSEQQQAQLLSGVFGVARERATPDLTNRRVDCPKRAVAAN